MEGDDWSNMRCASSCSYGGCTTGKKSATSLDTYCALLRDEAANNYCGQTERRESFQRAGCSGTF
jgi:hypothetical protein